MDEESPFAPVIPAIPMIILSSFFLSVGELGFGCLLAIFGIGLFLLAIFQFFWYDGVLFLEGVDE
jgi:hypothetical protein